MEECLGFLIFIRPILSWKENLGRMVNFAKVSQEVGLIPIVEPEILLDGNHTTTRCEEVKQKFLSFFLKNL